MTARQWSRCLKLHLGAATVKKPPQLAELAEAVVVHYPSTALTGGEKLTEDEGTTRAVRVPEGKRGLFNSPLVLQGTGVPCVVRPLQRFSAA
jgi:hypothetical protein